MEPYNNRRDSQSDHPGGTGGTQALIPGLILVGVGAFFLINNLHIIRDYNLGRYWPAILIAIGLVQLVDSGPAIKRIFGGMLIAAGGLLLANNFGYVAIEIEDLWPLILIGIGLVLLVNRTGWFNGSIWGGNFSGFGFGRYGDSLGGRRWTRDQATYGSNTVHEFTIFGGSKRIITAPDFQGGHASSIFGGINLDLTGAGMAGTVAVLNVNALYGGIAVRIPPTWSAEVHGMGIFGGFADHTIHPPITPDTKRLIVRGGAFCGGVAVKN